MTAKAQYCLAIKSIIYKQIKGNAPDIEIMNKGKTPIARFNALLKLLKKVISAYGRTNKAKAVEFDERLKSVIEAYNSRDKLVFTSEIVSDFANDLSD